MEVLVPQLTPGPVPASGHRPDRAGGIRALLAAAGAAVVAVQLARRLASSAVRDAEDLSHVAGVDVIGTIPRFGSGATRAGARPTPDAEALAAYRAIRAMLQQRTGDPQVVVLASARSGDGKTTSAANLATVTAQEGKRVLLVDAETRRGDQHALFGVQSEPGFFDLLLGQASDEACIRHVMRDGAAFDLLPSGGASQTDAADFIAAGLFGPVLERLRDRYDVIYVDSPPLERFTDAASLGSHADAVLFVARAGRSPRRAVRNAMRELRHVRAAVAGALLNDVGRR